MFSKSFPIFHNQACLEGGSWRFLKAPVQVCTPMACSLDRFLVGKPFENHCICFQHVPACAWFGLLRPSPLRLRVSGVSGPHGGTYGSLGPWGFPLA